MASRGVAERRRPADLRTTRLRLRPYLAADFDTLFRQLVLDPVVIRFWHAYSRPGLAESEMRSMAEHDLGRWIEEGIAAGHPTWMIEVEEAEIGPVGDFVGVVGVFPPQNEWGPEPEVGYLLASRYHGRGLATEALAAVVFDATERLGIPVLVAIVDEPNVASIRVLEKCGFTHERSFVGRDGHPYRRYVRRAGAPAPS